MKNFARVKPFSYLMATILGYGKGKYTKPRNPIYGFSRIPIIDKINSGQLEEISYVEGEGIVDGPVLHSR